MYHPMLTFAVARTRLDDLDRDLQRHRRRRQARSTAPTRPGRPTAY